MPNTKSASKRLKQDEGKRLHRRAYRSSVKTQIKKVQEATAAGDFDKANEEFRLACKKLDKAGARNVFHRNAVARYKSRLNAAIKRAKEAAAG